MATTPTLKDFQKIMPQDVEIEYDDKLKCYVFYHNHSDGTKGQFGTVKAQDVALWENKRKTMNYAARHRLIGSGLMPKPQGESCSHLPVEDQPDPKDANKNK